MIDGYRNRTPRVGFVGWRPAAPAAAGAALVRVDEGLGGWNWRPAWVSFGIWLAALAIYAATLGPDATYDLRNYHLYNAFAVLHGRYEFDIAPGQVQTYLNPTADFPGYFLRLWLADRSRLLNAALAVPFAVAAQVVTLIALRFVPGQGWRRLAIAMLAAGFGVSGAATLPTIATTQSGILADCCVLFGVLALLDCFGARAGVAGPSLRLVAAGLAFGLGFGLKMTEVAYCLGGAAAVLLLWPGSIRHKAGAGLVFGCSVAAGAVATGGWWWWRLWAEFGNPLFPYYNNIFGSPYSELVNGSDERFKPANWLLALFYPVYWGLSTEGPISDFYMRDPRMMVALAAAIVAGFGVFRGWSAGSRPVAALLVFFAASYVAWEALFSILRYLAPVEMLCGVVLWLPLRTLAARGRRVLAGGLAGLLAISTVALTLYPDYERGAPGAHALAVNVPQLEPDALLLILDHTPASYMALFVPTTVRVVGVRNNLVWPERPTLLQARVAGLVRGYRGPIYGLEYQGWGTWGDDSLEYYGLRRAEARCAVIEASFDPTGLRLCPLLRTEGGR